MCSCSTPAAASPGVAATLAPNASRARAFASVRFHTVTASPRRSIPSTIPPPSSPVPRNPTVAIASLPVESTPVFTRTILLAAAIAALVAALSVTMPYYEFREVLSVRDGDAGRFRSLADLGGKTVGTLGGTIAYEILLRAERQHGLRVVSYDDDVHPYSDLVIGRVDAVLLDNVLAERRHRAMRGFTIQPDTVAIGHYVGVVAADKGALRDSFNEI